MPSLNIFMKVLLFALALILGTSASHAQGIAVNAYGWYIFGDDVTLQYGYAHIDECPVYGGSLEFMMPRNVSVELAYQYQSTQASASSGLVNERGNIGISYILIEGNRYAKMKENISGYFGGGLGMAIISPDGNYESVGRLAWRVKAGVLISANEKIGVKLGMQLNSCVQGLGGGLYFGTGGASAGMTAYSSMYQFGFTGGLQIRFGGEGRSN
jgi:opacity protein-like surface antigen